MLLFSVLMFILIIRRMILITCIVIQMSALNPRIGHIEEHLYRDIDEMGRLHQLLGTTNSYLQKVLPNDDNTGNTQGKYLKFF